MRPEIPLMWIGTTKKNRDEGLYHLIGNHPAFSEAACGAKPFAYSGVFPDAGNLVPSLGERCKRCEKMAAKLR